MNAPLSEVAKTHILSDPSEPHYLECEIELASGRVLGRETFRLESFEGQERVSEPFEFSLTLHGSTDLDSEPLAFSQLIGRPVNLGVSVPDATFSSGPNLYEIPDWQGGVRTLAAFNGMVSSFGMQEPGVYRLEMRPTLWRMTLTNHYRMFRQMSVRDVLTSLCREHRVQANFDAVSGADNMAVTRVQDWLQAGESDYEFMRRLMGKAHVFFFFTHQYGRHVLVFANRASYPLVFKDDRPLRYTWTSEEELGLHQPDVVSQYSFQQSLVSSGVRGVFASEEQASNVDNRIASYASFRATSVPDVGELPFHQYRIYQYGGSNNEVRHYTQASHDAIQTACSQLSGASFCPLFRVGHQFHMCMMGFEVRPELEHAHFVLTSVSHRASLDGEYSNQFQACDARGLITPLSVSDTQQGALLAKVVAHRPLSSPRGWPYYTPDNFDMLEEQLIDDQGVESPLRAKGVYVRFSTDDEATSPVWVKLMPSMQTVPEVGTMVLVSRANDESELPEIQAIHSDGSMVVTPSDWTAHTQVGNNFSTSYGDGKSLRFGTRWSGGDTDRAVSIVETAYARGVFRDCGYSRGGSYGYSCSEEMENGMLGENWSYGCNYSYTWAKETKGFSAIGRSYQESVIGSCDTSLASTEAGDAEVLAAVQASKSLVIGNTYSKNESRGDTKSVAIYNGKVVSDTTHNGKVVSKTAHNGTVESNTTHNGDVSSVTTINADSNNSSTITGTSTNTSTHTTVANTTTIGSQTSTSTIGTNSSDDTIGVSKGNSTTGSREQNSMTGSSDDKSIQGSVKSLSVTGTSSSLAVTGVNSSMSVTGTQNSLNVVGASSSIDILGAGLSLSVKGAVASIEISGPCIQIPIIVMVM